MPSPTSPAWVPATSSACSIRFEVDPPCPTACATRMPRWPELLSFRAAMAASASTQTNPASDGITLAELLALSPTAASARSRVELPLDDQALQAIAACSRDHGLLPDSAFVAAWAMLQQPWCGRRVASWCEGSAAAGWREVTQALDMQQPASAFLRSVDQARRGAHPADAPRHDSAWGGADVAPNDVVLALHVDTGQGRLVATLPAEV